MKLLAALLLCFCAGALAADAELSAEVPAEKWRALRLRGLPEGASLSVRTETSGPIRVILARQDEVNRFPKGLKLYVQALPARKPRPKAAPPQPGMDKT